MYKTTIPILLTIFCIIPSYGMKVFDMKEICDPNTLEVKVLQDWHRVKGVIETRQKLVSINVGNLWAGQEYRVPVRMVVPANRKAKGFHLTGSSNPKRLENDTRPDSTERELLKGGVGLVITVVQEPGTYGQRKLSMESEQKFAKSLNPRFKIQYWAWPATLMRAITTAYAEKDHFEKGKVAASGGSKNGASPSMAIIHDERMTAVHATVSPIWDSPLRLNDEKAWKELRDQPGRRGGFTGGHFGPNFNQRVLDAGGTWKDLQNFTREISDQVFISRNLKALRKRGIDMLFHPGTHDFVAFDMAWGGKHHPTIPIYLGANTGHGKRGHPKTEKDQQNKAAFMLKHFFPQKVEGALLEPPNVESKVKNKALEVTVTFPNDSREESGRIWWIFDRAPDGSPNYISEMIPDNQTMEMKKTGESWTATIPLSPTAKRIDFFSNHSKTLSYHKNAYKTYISSPYTRVSLNK